MNTKKTPLLVIAGPTASGKSTLALALSRYVPATIINADASQVYRDLRIVSARPSPQEEAQASHRLFGYLDGAENCTAARWASDARAAITQAHADGRLPLLVGGSGLYLRTLLDGIAPVPAIDPAIRAQVRTLCPQEAHSALSRLDPVAASRLNANDTTRVQRALEVIRSTGKPLSHWQGARIGGIADQLEVMGIVLLPPRDWLRARCDARFDAMMAAGAETEVRALLARHLSPSLPVMRAIGVAQIAAMLADPANRPTLAEAAKAATRQYAKRQYTWFRHQAPANWMRIEAQFNTDFIEEKAIKLRNAVLTRSFITHTERGLQI